jgi:cell division protein FtsQ
MDNTEQNIFIKKKRLFFIIILVSFASLGFVANKWRWDLTIERIKIEGNNLCPNESLIVSSGLKIGSSMYEYDLKDIEGKVCKNPYVRSAIVNRNLPAEMIIQINERAPIAEIITDKIYYLDCDKKLFSYNFHKEILDLPIITGLNLDANFKGLSEDKRLDSVVFLLKILKNKYEDVYNLISEIDIKSSSNFIFYTSNNCVPVLFGEGESEDKIANLNAFINSYLDDIKKVESIDLRYRDQVIVRWK